MNWWRPPSTDLRITHTYNLAGRRYDKTVDLPKPGGYTIWCEGDPENLSLTLAVPSQ